MSEVADRMKHTLEITGGNPDAVDGNAEAWVNCDFCSNRREVCTKDTEWEPCPRCSTRPLAPVPTSAEKKCALAAQAELTNHGLEGRLREVSDGDWGCDIFYGSGDQTGYAFIGFYRHAILDCAVCNGETLRIYRSDEGIAQAVQFVIERSKLPKKPIELLAPVRVELGGYTVEEVCKMRGVEYDPAQDSTRPENRVPPVPTKPKECKCEEENVWERINREMIERACEPVGLMGMDKPLGDHIADTSKMVPNCLQTADRLTSQDRNEAYGHPLDDYECTAALWTAILRHAGVLAPDQAITAELAIQCMVQVKLSRQSHQHKDDNLIDAAGYIRCLEMVRQERERRALAALDELTRLGQEQGGYE